MTNQEKLIAYATTADVGELTSTIRILSVIRDSRVQAAVSVGVGATKKISAKKPDVVANSENNSNSSSTSATKAKAADDGKDPERVERGRRAAETRAKNKALKEAEAQGQERTVDTQSNQAPAVAAMPVPEAVQAQPATASQTQSVAEDDLDLDNFQVPRVNFGEEGELIRDNT